MTLGPIVDVIIGLVFTYFLLSLIASGVQEVAAGIFQWRGTYLTKGINVLLDSAPDAAFGWTGIGDFLVGHFTWIKPPTPPSPNPAYPPPDASTEQKAALAHQRVVAVQSHPLVRGSPTGVPSYVSARNFALALLEALRDGSSLPLFSQAERTIGLLPDGDLKRALSLFVQNAGGDLDLLRAQIEQWFDDAMDRLSGIYARISQYSMIVLGVALAVSLNVDSVRLARTLWQDPVLRGQLTAAATLDAAGPGPQEPASHGGPQPAAGAMRASYQDLMAQDLPVGWSEDTGPTGRGALMRICGWVFTAAAVSLGAPFWFSLLQQLTNFRNAGPKPGPSDASTARGAPATGP